FNVMSKEQTTVEEMYVLLLPLILKDGWYCFYKDYVVHYWAIDDFDQADYLLDYQADKPRYVPDENEFLNYINEYYVGEEDHWWNVLSFMKDAFGRSKNTVKAYHEVRNFITDNNGINGLGAIFNKYNIVFENEEQVHELVDSLFYAKNNTRIWENNGYTPAELHEIMNENNKNVIQFPKNQNIEVGRNDPCPCGSGKKYKKCCGSVNNQKIGWLNRKDCREFFETWYGLLAYVNTKKNVIKEKMKPIYPNPISDVKIYKIREVLWEKPEMIDDYISETDLSKEKVETLKLWREKHIVGDFIFLHHQQEYTIVLELNEQNDNRVYAVKGISRSIPNTLNRELPVRGEAVLIPFKGHIIFDSFLNSYSISFGKGIKASFNEWYEEALAKGIVTSLE
ncbi:MAG: SEC-C metal-binding domain-containing protein, partial [Bacillota bacterium]